MVEQINHPPHYGGADNLYEHVKVMEARLTHEQFVGAMVYQITKYLDRLGKKAGAPAELDAAKAAWFSDRLTKYLVASKPRSQAMAQPELPSPGSSQNWVPAGVPFDTDMRPNPDAYVAASPTGTLWLNKDPQAQVKGGHKK